jgi:hypothetical protein
MTTSSILSSPGDAPTFRRSRAVIYWVATAFVAGTAVVAGAMDLLRMQPLSGALAHLGYPPYFGGILGAAKVLGAAALVAPRAPRLKEWAYAGMFFDYVAAVASYVAIGEATAANLGGPIVSAALLVASWAARPASRRLA